MVKAGADRDPREDGVEAELGIQRKIDRRADMFPPDAEKEADEHRGSRPEGTLFRGTELVALVDEEFVDERMVLEKGAGAAIAEVIDLRPGMRFMELTDQGCREKHIPDPERVDDQKGTAFERFFFLNRHHVCPLSHQIKARMSSMLRPRHSTSYSGKSARSRAALRFRASILIFLGFNFTSARTICFFMSWMATRSISC